MVPGSAPEPAGQRRPGALHLPGRQGRTWRTAPEQLAFGLRRSGSTRVTEADGTPGQWYLHLFAPEQPDVNWDNPEVFDDFADTLRFWLDRGIDGFRLDVAHGMAKPPGLPDIEDTETSMLHIADEDPRFNNEGVHEYHRKIRKVLDQYRDVVAVGEIWVNDNTRFAEYVRPDELHLGFNFKLVEADFDADQIRAAIQNSLAAVDSVGATPTWTLSNHDVEREVTRYGDGQIGQWRARAMALVMLALPGTVFIYNGSELGLPNVELPDEALQDPVWERSGHTERGRDGCRVPIPWEGTDPPYGFGAMPRPGCPCHTGGPSTPWNASWSTPTPCCRCTGGPSNCARAARNSPVPAWSGTAAHRGRWPSASKAVA